MRAAALQRLCDATDDDRDVRAARAAAMRVDPVRAILERQDPAGWWVKPGPGYAPKYRSTVWSVIFLDQLGADPQHPQVVSAVDYLLAMTATSAGGFGCSSSKAERPPPPSTALHCLNGNLLRAFIGFGRLDDPHVQAAVEWAARTITGERVERWYASSTPGPGFACAANENLPCAWGAVKQMLGLARVPDSRRSPLVRRAVAQGVEFLLSVDPAGAMYPMGWGNTKPNGSWFKLGFPSGYVTDVLQVLEAVVELGHGQDARLANALEWVEAEQTTAGGWLNRYAYNGKTWTDIERQGQPSKWVTLRACAALRAAYG
ncbi:MAG: nitrogen fixation protein NifH [Angustibacter sp.]